MAVNYGNLFGAIGEHVQAVNQMTGWYADLDSRLTETEADLDTAGVERLFGGLPALYDGFKTAILGWTASLKGEVDKLITHQDLVKEQLAVSGSASVNTTLVEIFRDMVDNTQHVLQSVVTVGSVTKDVTNSGAGTVITGKVLDGVTAPSSGWPTNKEYAGLSSQLAKTNEDHWLTCISDSESDGLNEGAEVFSWIANPSQSAWHWETEGSGDGANVTVSNGATLLTNGEFENFTSNTPDNWTVVAGVANTDFRQGSGADVHRGTASLNIDPTGSTDANLTQNITVTPLKRYIIGVWGKATPAGNAHVDITVEDASSTYATLTLHEGVTSGLNGTFSLFTQAFNTPAELDGTVLCRIKNIDTTATDELWIDGLVIAPVSYHGGIHVAIFAGNEKFLRGDRLKFNVSNNNAGVFQTFFRRGYNFQLPTSGTPSIADSLAT